VESLEPLAHPSLNGDAAPFRRSTEAWHTCAGFFQLRVPTDPELIINASTSMLL
jgi:hypothetical protein